MFHANNIAPRLCASYQTLPADGLQNYFITIQTSNAFLNRNVICYNLTLFTRTFQPKLDRKIGIFSRRRKINILTKRECIIFLIHDFQFMVIHDK